MTAFVTLLGAIFCLATALVSPIISSLAWDHLVWYKAAAAHVVILVIGFALFIAGVVTFWELADHAWGTSP